MNSQPLPSIRPELVGDGIESVEHSPSLNNGNDTQTYERPEHDDSSHHSRPLLEPFLDIPVGIRRRPTLPISSQVPTPQGSDDEGEDGEDGEGKEDKEDREEKDKEDKDNKDASDTGPSTDSDDSEGSEDTPSTDKVMKKLGALVGVDDVKAQFEELRLYIQHSKSLNISLVDDRFHALFQGNPGTGKTTVAKLYAEFLKSMGVLESDDVLETTGAKLGSNGARDIIETFEEGDGGVLFVDEAYQLVATHSSHAGKQVLDVILGEMDKSPPKWVLIFAGYKEEFEPFFAHNDGLSSRIPQVLTFEDFSNTQLHSILLRFFNTRFAQHRSNIQIEGNPNGRYMDAVVRRIAQGRARRGFGNARTVRNYFQRICQRQAHRVGQLASPTIQQRLYFSKEDLLGQRPLDLKATSKSWAKLNSLIGLSEVKKSVEIMFQIVDTNYQRELRGKRPYTHSLNRVFVGSPGTGKTTVAKLYGKILAELGFLSKGDVVIKTPADFIGDAVGRSESNTRAILASTLGKVLIIDEAYMLDPGDATVNRDSYKTAVLDSIVAEVQGNPGDDRCVLLLGYEDRMESLFQNGNPGLSGRFMADLPFRFPDFSDPELREILKLDLKGRHINYEPAALDAAVDLLSRYKCNRDFSNAREVKLLVSDAVFRNQERLMSNQNHDEDFEPRLEPEDFDPWLRPQGVSTGNVVNCRLDLSGHISDSVIEQLERYFPSSLNRELNRHIPRTFVFKGPPGTGKTTVAKYMGKLFRDIGLLPAHQFVLRSAKDFIGQHVGQTMPQTRKLLESGFGRVLIIRDIHLIAKGGYSSEALDELTSFVRTYSGRMAIILTGPSEPVDDLLSDRHELGTMFPDRIIFRDLTPLESLNLLHRLIQATVPGAQTPFFASQTATEMFEKAISILTMFEGRGNASLARTLSIRMVQKGDHELLLAASRDPGRTYHWKLTEGAAMSCIRFMFEETRRNGVPVRKIVPEPASEDRAAPEGTDITQPTQATIEATSEPKRVVHARHQVENVSKDNPNPAGDKDPKPKESGLQDKPTAKEAASTSNVTRVTEDQIRQQDKDLEESERENQSVQEAIKRMGKCENNYDWDRVAGGYKCRGGYHFVTDAEVAAYI
ncbi:unnamed protein product [Fusarium graminearum]|nr:unnamed protein product [Fusarium graminearum]